MSQDGAAAAAVLAQRYADVVASLSTDEWAAPSRCAGWSVQDLVAHTGSNFHVVVEPDVAPDDAPPVAEDLQELLVHQRRGWSAGQVAEEFEKYRDPAVAAFRAVQEEPAASSPLTLSELGTYPLHALADAFAFDMWCHLYVDLLAPGGPVRRQVPEPEDALLTPGIGWMLAGLPQMCRALTDVVDRPLALRLDGPGGGAWTLHPGAELITITPGADTDAAATVTSKAVDFVLWGTTRAPWREHVTLAGDTDYAATVLDRVDIV